MNPGRMHHHMRRTGDPGDAPSELVRTLTTRKGQVLRDILDSWGEPG